SPAALKRSLATRWHAYYDQGSHIGYKGHGAQVVGARPAPHFFRGDSVPADGMPGSDYELMREQLLEGHNVVKAVLTPLDSIAFPQHGELGAALVTALNTWMVEDWFERDDRLFGVISV